MQVIDAIIENGIDYHFSVQARFEIGFDDELLAKMKTAGFIEVSLGIEFIDDDSFKHYGKKSTHDEIVYAIKNIHAHGIGVRGLFIVGSDYDKPGIGDRIADFVIENGIHGVLIQTMFFTPGTSFYEKNKHRLIHQDWSKYDGNVVHYPANISPYQLQKEIIHASAKIYSLIRLATALLKYKWINKFIFIGEYFWHMNIRKDLRKELTYLKRLEKNADRSMHTERLKRQISADTAG